MSAKAAQPSDTTAKPKGPPSADAGRAGKGGSKGKSHESRPVDTAPSPDAQKTVASEARAARVPVPTPRLKEFYVRELRPKLMAELPVSNINQVPRLRKIVLNSGLGEGTKDFKVIEEMSRDLAIIAGQKPMIRRATKDVSAFGVRAGNPIGLMVTLRNKRMYEFLDRFISVTLPRVRDFRGISPKNFDRRGNLTIGIREHTVFPEVDIDKVHRTKGMNVTFVTTAGTDAHAQALLQGFGMPFTDRT